MDELRKDLTRGQWVLVRPKSKPPAEEPCPFCPGAESETGPEIAAYRKDGGAQNTAGWTVRVVPEPDAYFRIEWELVREGIGMFDMIIPRGASELIVESPRHEDTLASMGLGQIESVLWMYRDRLLDLKRDSQIRDILISRHHKKPGVPGHHPYSRVTAIPIVFDETRRELREAREYYQYKRRCLYCDVLRQEIGGEERVIRLTPSFVVLVPYAPRVPLETWILPRRHGCSYEEALTSDTAPELARLLGEYCRTIERHAEDPAWELVLHTAPNLRSRILQGDWATIRDDYHWHLEILPQPERLNRVGGIFVNETPPEDAA
ncbi:MAG: galactose-1-phosphate uridylyltransferase, partial [Candidatus Rokubacteria bacterium]|nr:galactose-1-phosphate uridylyltransferase [Candidatus Rokubacteria bacterium]